jgi:Ca2+-binding EF-hand superfamily protein
MAGPPMADSTMSGFMSLQTAPPTASDMASKLMSMLDSDGDGSISATEASASGGSDAASAFSALDTNGDGQISADELTSAVQDATSELANAQGSDGQSAQGPGAAHHGRHHHHGSATDLASGIMDAGDSDSSGGLSLDEVSSALGTSSSDTQSGFSALDSDGNGQLSVSELTSAISKYMQTRLTDMAQQSQTSTAAVTA